MAAKEKRTYVLDKNGRHFGADLVEDQTGILSNIKNAILRTFVQNSNGEKVQQNAEVIVGYDVDGNPVIKKGSMLGAKTVFVEDLPDQERREARKVGAKEAQERARNRGTVGKGARGSRK